MQTIVLRFDYQSSYKIEELQKQTNAGSLKKITSLPPHITLQAFTEASPADLQRALQPVAEKTDQIKINFSSIGFFKQKGTFFLAPVQTGALKNIHQSVLLATREFNGSDSLYQINQWVPHATVANGVAAQFWGPLFSRLSLEFQPFNATVTAIECWSIINGETENDWSFFFN